MTFFCFFVAFGLGWKGGGGDLALTRRRGKKRRRADCTCPFFVFVCVVLFGLGDGMWGCWLLLGRVLVVWGFECVDGGRTRADIAMGSCTDSSREF